MLVHIKYDNEKKDLILPVNPSQLMLSGSQQNSTVNIHNLGEINLKGKRGLKSITLESFFPSSKYDFAKTKFKDPDTYIRTLDKLFENNDTIHLIVTDSEINDFFTISRFEHGYNDSSLDVAYVLELIEYREIGTTKGTKKRVTKSKKTTSYVWKKGDTWQKLTQKTLGSSATWKEQRKNNISIVNAQKKKKPNLKEVDALVGCKVVIKV